MAGVYHNREWVEIDGSTIISTSALREEIEKSDGEWEYVRGLEWVLNNASFVNDLGPSNVFPSDWDENYIEESVDDN